VSLVSFIPLAERNAQCTGEMAARSGALRRMTVDGHRMVIKPYIVPAPDEPLKPLPKFD